MTDQAAYDKVMARALRLLALRPRSRGELRQKLLEKNPGSESIIGQVIARLEELGYLNDAQLAADYAQTRVELRPVGRRRLKNELRKRMIAEDLIDRTLDDVYTEQTQTTMMDRAVQRWIRRRGHPHTRAELKKLYDYLLRLGFEPSQARERLQKINPLAVEDEPAGDQ